VLFGAPKRGWLKSMGFGLADLYNITGVMGDLLSYIRLFALGVSSAILGLVVNSIALSAQGIPYVGIVFTILILVVGHTANLMLASLSAFVHPMRLTFVEFYKNVGFVGGGKPYAPLARKNLKSKT
jgi:V/A-type H+-transporting ATPase subunit I